MTDADLARWAALDPDACPVELARAAQALVAEVRRLRAALTEIITYDTCGDACAEVMIETAQAALGDDGTLRYGVPQETTATTS